MGTIKLVVANTADKPAAAIGALAHGDYLMLNECRAQVLAWARKRVRLGDTTGGPTPKVGMYVSLQNVHLYRQSRVGVVTRGTKVLLTGGRKGLGKSRKDRRRRGPTRTSPWQLVFDRADQRLTIFVDLHMLARTQTSERWRWPLMLASLVRLRALLRWLQARFPGVPIVVGGDGNLAKLGAWKLGKGWRVVRTLPDFNARHYTQLWLLGDVQASDVGELHNVSDHDAVTATLTIGPAAPRRKS